MFEKLKEKLKKIFADKGIDEEISKEVLDELDKGEEEPTPEEEVQPEVTEETTVEAESQEEPKEEPEAVLPDEAQAEAVPLPEEQPEPKPEEAPIVEEPQFDYQELKAELDEYKKTVDALLARTESLEEALRAGGVIEGEKPEKGYGVDKPSAPAKDPVGDGLDEFFRQANRKSF